MKGRTGTGWLKREDEGAKVLTKASQLLRIMQEQENIERLVREFVSVRPCECVTGTQCWTCVFRYNLGHLDAAKLPS